MNKTSKYSILAIVAIGITSVGFFSATFSLEEDVETFEKTKTIVNNLYAEEHVPLDYQKNAASDIVKGTIISKTTILEYRDVEGNYLKENDPSIAVTEPFIVYELNTEKPIKTKDSVPKSSYIFKVYGGEINGNTIISDVPEFNVGDNLIVILSEAPYGDYQELLTGVFSVYKVQNGKAIGEQQTFNEKNLLELLK